MGRTELGKSIHAFLVSEAKKKLQDMGCSYILTEARLESLDRVDLMGILNDEKIGVECMVKCVPSLLKKKIEKYKPHLDRFVLCVPAYTKMPDTDEEVWRIDIPFEPPSLGERISFDLDEGLVRRLRLHIQKKYQGKMIHGKLKEALNEAVKDYVDKVEGAEDVQDAKR